MPIYTQRTFNVAATSTHDNVVPWVPLDMFADGFVVSFGIVLVAGGPINCRIVHTFDDVFNPLVTPVAFNHIDVTAAVGTNPGPVADGNYAFPVRATRLVITSAASAATFTYTVMQATQ